MAKQNYTKITALRITPLLVPEPAQEGKEQLFRIHITNEAKKPQSLLATKQVAHRIRIEKPDREFNSDYHLYAREDGVVYDYERDPRPGVLDTESESTNKTDKTVILRMGIEGTVSIDRRINVSNETALTILEGARDYLKENDHFVKHAPIGPNGLVMDVINTGRTIIVSVDEQ